MHIGPIRLLDNGTPNTKFDIYGRLCPGFTSLDWDDSAKIEEAIAANENNKDAKKDCQKKNRQLKRQKQYQKRAAKAKTRQKTC